jgi:hypothetical protein
MNHAIFRSDRAEGTASGRCTPAVGVLLAAAAVVGCAEDPASVSGLGTATAALGSVLSRDDWIDRFEALDSEINNGAGYSSSADSGTLAWQESAILSG